MRDMDVAILTVIAGMIPEPEPEPEAQEEPETRVEKTKTSRRVKK